MKIRVAWSRTIQVRQYEPERLELEVETPEGVKATDVSKTVEELAQKVIAAGDRLVAERAAKHFASPTATTPDEPDDFVGRG
jgi:hypothetical protein